MLILMILVSKRFFLFFLIFISCSQNNIQQYAIYGHTQGTTYVVKYNHTDNVIQKKSIDSLLHNIDLSMSSYIENSLISFINQGDDVVLDSLITQVLNRAIAICNETNGMFDITVAPLVDYWGFGPEKIRRYPEKIDVSFDVIGCDKIVIKNKKLIKSDSVSIDLNGIAQGFTVDYLSQYLFDNNINDFMVEVGGEIYCADDNLGAGWKIGIDEPTDLKRDFSFILNLKNVALATSGSYRNYYYDDSLKISHTINPKTFRPARNELISTTILHSDRMSADAYATACMSFGLKGAQDFLKTNNITGCLIYIDDGDTLAYFTSKFSSFLHRSPGSAPQ